MNRCKRCVLPDTRPDTHFEAGICSACRAYDARSAIDWVARLAELLTLLDRHDGRCIVPSSGGKDSHAQVLSLLDLGADVTVVTATTCYLTEIGRKNIDNLARYAPTIEVTPNMTVRAKLNRLGLELVGDVSHPEHMSIFTTPFKIAVAMGIPLIFYGECPQNELGGPAGTEQARELTLRWRSEFGGFLGLRPSDLIGQLGITARDMEDYMPPSVDQLSKIGVEAHFLGQYLPWDSRKNARRAADAGMKQQLPTQANLWNFENLDCALTGLHDFFGWLKYGISRAAVQASMDIRRGRMTRDEALNLIRQRDGMFPYPYMGVSIEEVLLRLGMTRVEVTKLEERFTGHVDARAA